MVAGDGSQLADSFENLSMCNPEDTAELPSHVTDYENINLVASHLDKPMARAKPMLKHHISGITTTKCSQIRELWTPPCSPDYRDYTTSDLQPLHSKFIFTKTPTPTSETTINHNKYTSV